MEKLPWKRRRATLSTVAPEAAGGRLSGRGSLRQGPPRARPASRAGRSGPSLSLREPVTFIRSHHQAGTLKTPKPLNSSQHPHMHQHCAHSTLTHVLSKTQTRRRTYTPMDTGGHTPPCTLMHTHTLSPTHSAHALSHTTHILVHLHLQHLCSITLLHTAHTHTHTLVDTHTWTHSHTPQNYKLSHIPHTEMHTLVQHTLTLSRPLMCSLIHTITASCPWNMHLCPPIPRLGSGHSTSKQIPHLRSDLQQSILLITILSIKLYLYIIYGN